MTSFQQQVANYTKKYEKQLRATAREAVQETVAIAQTPRGAGGRMRVDTGFLRASIVAGLGRMPSGPTQAIEDAAYNYTGTAVAAALLRWDPNTGQTFFAGWSANYARPREFRDGFLRGATEQWPKTVDSAAKRVRRSI